LEHHAGQAQAPTTAQPTVFTTQSLTVNGSLDLKDNDIIVDYSGSSPIDAIRGYILSGRGASGGINDVETWNGATGIKSSTAANIDPSQFGNFSIGYSEASDYGGLGSYANYDGQTVDSSAVLIRYTALRMRIWMVW